MLNFKHFKIGKEEYIILKKDTLEDVLNTVATLTSMLEQNYLMIQRGYGDPNFDISTVTIGDELKFASKHSVNYRKIVDRVLENL